MRSFVKRPGVIIAIVVATLGSSGLAVAYWTTTGSGSGTANLSPGTSTVTLAATVPDGLAPSVDRFVTIKATPSSAESVYIGNVRLTATTADAGHSTCNGSWFTMADVTVDQTVPGTVQTTLSSTGTLHMTDDPVVNQNACKGAALTLTLTVV